VYGKKDKMLSSRKILLCLTGSGASEAAKHLKEFGALVYDNNDANREVIKEHMQNRSVVVPNVLDPRRIICIVNSIDRVTNRTLKNYRYLVLVENRMNIPNSERLTALYNMNDYYLDSRMDLRFQTKTLIEKLSKK